MDFALTDSMIMDIVFCMEDQNNTYVFDLKNRTTMFDDAISEAEDYEESDRERFVPIPEWTPADGFRLMEMFASRVNNPLVKSQLNDVLSRGRGVFREFKNVLKREPIIERQWFEFKDEMMRNRVISWFNELNDVKAYRELDIEFEETPSELVALDFSVLENPEENLVKIAESFEEECADDLEWIEGDAVLRRMNACDDEKYMIAVDSEGNFTGFIGWEPIGNRYAEIVGFGVVSQFRGMGLFSYMLDHFVHMIGRKGFSDYIISIPDSCSFLKNAINRGKGRDFVQKMTGSVASWEEEFISTEQAYL